MTGWIEQLCDHVGIDAAYRGFDGGSVHASIEARMAVLRAMDIPVETEADACDRLLAMQEAESRHPAQAEAIVTAGEASRIELSQPVEWALEAEGGTSLLASGSASGHVDLPALPIGIHRLTLSAQSRDWITWVLARPAHAVSLAERTGGDRAWGVTAALYGLTDRGQTALGSYAALAGYAEALATHGADFIGVNPVHAMGRTRPDGVISPYSPSHREFLNTWHADICANGASGASAGSAALIDYPAALAASDAGLRAEFDAFAKDPTGSDTEQYAAFAANRGAVLQDYALFEALADAYGADWRDWPAAIRNRDTAALMEFALENRQAIQFYTWSQWRADQDLQRAQDRSLQAGMRVGLYLDLAVGPRAGGAETWAEGTSLARGATLGAPPDALAPGGQNWGLAPQSPHLCSAQGYAGFARLLRSVMRHAGMIRMDHILGLMRSFWIPEGLQEGAYVRYPFDALLAVVAIESARSGVIVIGEDLGLVPDGLREKLAASGVYGLDVMQYMRDEAGGFQNAKQMRPKAISAFATHDTPTITGFFTGEDIKLQVKLGAIDHETGDAAARDRDAARAALNSDQPVGDVHGMLAAASSEIVAVQLDDMACQSSQQNMPGTIDEYPNWRRQSAFSAADIRCSDSFAKLGDLMRAHGRANSRMNGDGQWRS